MKNISNKKQNEISYVVASNVFKEQYFSFDGENCYLCYLYRGQFKKKLSVFNLFEDKNANEIFKIIEKENFSIKKVEGGFITYDENHSFQDEYIKSSILIFLFNKYKRK